MRTTYISTVFCVLIVLLGITLSAIISTDNDEYAALPAVANFDWSELDNSHQLDERAAKSRFWKRAPHRKFWKRSALETAH